MFASYGGIADNGHGVPAFIYLLLSHSYYTYSTCGARKVYTNVSDAAAFSNTIIHTVGILQ